MNEAELWIMGHFHNLAEKQAFIIKMMNELPRRAKVLNVGCKLFMLPDYFDTTNIDIVPQPIPNFMLADVRNLPFPDKSFDAVFCSHVLEHIPKSDVKKAMDEMHRVVKTPEHIYIILPDPKFPQTRYDPDHKWIPRGDNSNAF